MHTYQIEIEIEIEIEIDHVSQNCFRQLIINCHGESASWLDPIRRESSVVTLLLFMTVVLDPPGDAFVPSFKPMTARVKPKPTG
jgi:hypothetical protein